MKSGEKRVEKSPRVCRVVIKVGDPFRCFIAVLNTRKDAVLLRSLTSFFGDRSCRGKKKRKKNSSLTSPSSR